MNITYVIIFVVGVGGGGWKSHIGRFLQKHDDTYDDSSNILLVEFGELPIELYALELTCDLSTYHLLS